MAREFIELGFKAVIVCVDTTKIDASFVGRMYDGQLLRDLPKSADPCGENGEFHSFVYAGPIFKKEIEFKIGKKVLRNGKRFCFCDLIPA